MPDRIEATDPRGWKVFCTQDQWRFHILGGHPDMDGWEGMVQEAVKHPTFGIYQDADRPDRQIYYLRDGLRYTKVVTQIVEEGRAEIISAYKTDGMKSREVLIWPTSND